MTQQSECRIYNKKYHKYFYAVSSLETWSLGSTRYVLTKPFFLFFMWRFDRISNTDRYHIWNVKLGLPLSMTRYFKRQAVCLKNQPIEDLDMLKNFEWILKFLDDLNPII